MEFRNMPREDGFLSAPLFLGCRMKTDAPVTKIDLQARTDWNAAAAARQLASDKKRLSAYLRFTTRPTLQPGQNVHVQNPATKRWDQTATIIEAHNKAGRTSKINMTSTGQIMILNKLLLRPVPSQESAKQFPRSAHRRRSR
jgi:hypothetical protein